MIQSWPAASMRRWLSREIGHQRGLLRFTRLDLDEDDEVAAIPLAFARDDVDLPACRAPVARRDAVALRHEVHDRDGLGHAAPSLRALPFGRGAFHRSSFPVAVRPLMATASA